MFVQIEKDVTVDVDPSTRRQFPIGGPFFATKEEVAAVVEAGAGFEVDEEGDRVAPRPAKPSGKSDT